MLRLIKNGCLILYARLKINTAITSKKGYLSGYSLRTNIVFYSAKIKFKKIYPIVIKLIGKI